jgi:hypothetical protein
MLHGWTRATVAECQEKRTVRICVEERCEITIYVKMGQIKTGFHLRIIFCEKKNELIRETNYITRAGREYLLISPTYQRMKDSKRKPLIVTDRSKKRRTNTCRNRDYNWRIKEHNEAPGEDNITAG